MPSIYQQQIIDLYRYPLNKKIIENADLDYGDKNPSCGDDIHLYITLDEENKVKDVGFQGNGCAISQASVSLLTEEIKGKSIEEMKALTNDNILELLGIPITHARMKCAILSLKVLMGAIHKHEGGNVGRSA